MSAVAPYVFLAVAAPFAFWAAWSDLRRLIISNKLNIWLAVAFVPVGLVLLPLDVFGWRLLVGLIVLLIGYILNITGVVGGGDAKYAAALILYVAYEDLAPFFMTFLIMTISAFLTHRGFRLAGAAGWTNAEWKSWTSGKNFPMGLALSGALLFYLVSVAFFSFPPTRL